VVAHAPVHRPATLSYSCAQCRVLDAVEVWLVEAGLYRSKLAALNGKKAQAVS
jgi:hypothetical protein